MTQASVVDGPPIYAYDFYWLEDCADYVALMCCREGVGVNDAEFPCGLFPVLQPVSRKLGPRAKVTWKLDSMRE
jgi:hypothetical protein